MQTTIAILNTSLDLKPQAEMLARQLNLPIVDSEQTYDYLLVLTPHYLGLQKAGAKSHPLYVDFLSPEMTRRRIEASLRREALARALGLKGHTHPSIVDATAGLARDSFVLACLGFEVQLLERSPIIHALLADGLKRAAQDPKVALIVARLHLAQTDAISWLKTHERVDYIYLDPMFPERRKSALVKKNMQFFQDIVGDDTDAEALLQIALTCANKRVVVKRPRLAATLTGPKPTLSSTGSTSRFDIYLTQDAHGNHLPAF